MKLLCTQNILSWLPVLLRNRQRTQGVETLFLNFYNILINKDNTQKPTPMNVDILIKISDKNTMYSIEKGTTDIFQGDGIKHYQIGEEISIRLNEEIEFKEIIKNIKFWPSTSSNVLVLEIFI